MAFRSALQVGPEHVARLSPNELRDLMEHLLRSEAYRCGVEPSQIIVNAETSATDEGQDAHSPAGNGATPWLSETETCWQFKSSKRPTVKNEIRGHARVQAVLRRGGRYIVVASALGNGLTGIDTRVTTLKKEAHALGLPTDRIEVWSCDRIVRWCNEHPAIAARVAGMPADWSTIDEWAASFEHNRLRVPFVASTAVGEMLRSLQDAIDPFAGDTTHVHLWGPPGVGKTRLALETCLTAQWSREAVYARQGADGSLARILSDLARDRHARAVIVADELTGDDVAAASNVIHRAEGRLRLLSIGHERPPTALPLLAREVVPLDETSMMDFLGKIHSGMPIEHQRYVARLADGYVRLGVLIAPVVARDAATTTREVLQSADIRPLLRKLFRPDERSALHVLAALEYVGWEADVADEGRTIAEHFGASWGDVQTVVHDRVHGIVQKRGRYRYLSPRPLALHLANELWEARPDEMNALVAKLPREEARDSFYRRLGALASSGRAAEFSRRELSGFFHLDDFHDRLAVRRWRAISVAAPVDAVKRLGAALRGASHQARLSIPSGARREMIQSLVLAARSAATFEASTLALAELAEAETESWSNNATGEFAARFAIFGSGTAVPFVERMAVLDELTQRDTPYLILALTALRRATTTDTFQIVPAGLDAGPGETEWRPSMAEYIDAINMVLKRLAAIIARGIPALESGVLETVKKCTWLLVVPLTHDAAADFVRHVARHFPTLLNETENTLSERLRLERNYHHYGADKELLQRGELLLKEIGDPSPRGNLRRAMSISGRGAVSSTALRELSSALVSNEVPLLAEWRFLTSGQAHRVWELGSALAEADAARRLLPIMLSAPDRGPDLRLLCAYLNTRAATEPEGWLDAMLEAYEREHPEDIRLLFEATWRSKPSDTGATRIARLLRGRTLPFTVDSLAYGGWLGGLSRTAFATLLDALTELPEQQWAAAAVLDHRLTDQPEDFSSVEDMALAIATNPVVMRSHGMGGYHWQRIAERFVNTRPAELAGAIFHAHAEGQADGWFIQHSEAAAVLSACAESAPGAVWEALAPRLATPEGLRLSVGVPIGIIERASHDLVIAWTGVDPVHRAAILAGMLSKRYDDDALAAKLLDAFGGSEEVRAAFAGAYWSGTWNGRASARERSLATDLDRVAKESSFPHVRRWARETAEGLRQMAEREEAREAEEELSYL